MESSIKNRRHCGVTNRTRRPVPQKSGCSEVKGHTIKTEVKSTGWLSQGWHLCAHKYVKRKLTLEEKEEKMLRKKKNEQADRKKKRQLQSKCDFWLDPNNKQTAVELGEFLARGEELKYNKEKRTINASEIPVGPQEPTLVARFVVQSVLRGHNMRDFQAYEVEDGGLYVCDTVKFDGMRLAINAVLKPLGVNEQVVYYADDRPIALVQPGGESAPVTELVKEGVGRVWGDGAPMVRRYIDNHLESFITMKFAENRTALAWQVIRDLKVIYGKYAMANSIVREVMYEEWLLKALESHYSEMIKNFDDHLKLRAMAIRAKFNPEFKDRSRKRWWHYLLAMSSVTFGVSMLELSPRILLVALPCLAWHWLRSPRKMTNREVVEWNATRSVSGVTFVPLAKRHLIKQSKMSPDFKHKPQINPILRKPNLETPDKFIENYGTMINNIPLVIPAQDDDVLEAAIKIRMNFVRESDEKTVAEFVDFSRKHIDCMDSINLQPLSREEHLKNAYGEKKAKKIIEDHTQLGDDDIWASLFVKLEAYLGKSQENFKPRMIWARTPNILYWFSNYFHDLGNQLGKLFNINSPVYYSSKAKPVDLGRYAEKMAMGDSLYELDVSNFDGSISKEMLELEMYFLKNRVMGMPPEIEFLYDNWTKVWGKTHTGLSVKMEHGRRSGDLWTAQFNMLLNYLMSRFVEHKFGVKILRKIVLGDDSVWSTDKPLPVNDVIKLYADLGMTVKMFHRDSITDVEFCSGRFWPNAGKLIWGNKPFKVLSKIGMNYGKHDPKYHKRLLLGVAKGMLCTAGHIPIVGALFRAIADSGDKLGIKPYYDNSRENPYRPQGGMVFFPTSETYEMFANLYGADKYVLMELDKIIYEGITIDDFPGVFTGNFIIDMAKIDLDFEVVDTFDDHYEVTKIIPYEEEVHKLQMAKTRGLIQAGIDFGRSEMEECGSPSYVIFLHVLFTLVSHISLQAGVKLHGEWNSMAFKKQVDAVCARRNRRRKQKAPKVVVQVQEPMNRRKAVRKVYVQNKSLVDPYIKKGLEIGGGLGGRFIGNQFGYGDLGARYGRRAGSYISRIIGTGDYKVRKNSLLRGGIPAFKDYGRAVVISNREFLGDVQGSTSFSSTEYPINIGISATFPWGSTVGQNFDQYEIRGMVFEFKSTSATALNSTNTAMGVVVMATQYNSNRSSFINKQEMENYEFSTSTVPCNSCLHPIECAHPEKPVALQYVRTGDVSSTENLLFYDLGRFTIATVGMQASATIGELWVSYEIALFKPIMIPGAFGTAMWAHQRITAFDDTDILGPTIAANDGTMALTVSITGSGYDTVTLPYYITTGRFIVVCSWVGSATVGTALTTNRTNCTGELLFTNSTSASVASTGTVASFVLATTITITSGSAGFYFSSATLPTSGTYGDIWIVQVGSSDSAMMFDLMKQFVGDKFAHRTVTQPNKEGKVEAVGKYMDQLSLVDEEEEKYGDYEHVPRVSKYGRVNPRHAHHLG